MKQVGKLCTGGLVKMDYDKLILRRPGFEDPAFPGQTFYCLHCALVEGVLTSFPELAARLIIERIVWPRPEHSVGALVGEGSQSLPLLVLTPGETSRYRTGTYQDRVLVAGKDRILAALSERHGFPDPHHP
jgi:hypothetical protein